MAKKKPRRKVASLRFSAHLGHLLELEDLLTFIETNTFRRNWKACGLSDDDLFELQTGIMTQPKAHPVIEGTGGLRKIRFSPTGMTHGKSGSHRVCYVYFEEFGIILLVVAYPKNKQDNLSKEAKNTIRKMIEEQRKLLNRGPVK